MTPQGEVPAGEDRIVMEIERGDAPAGILRAAGETRRFEGWLELLALLERALEKAPQARTGASGRKR